MRRPALTLGIFIAVVVVAVQALLIPLFAAPAANLAPRDLPIAVAGPPQLAAQLAAGHPGAFEIRMVADAAAADAAIRNREVYGAIVVTPAGPEVHVASAASPTVSALLTQAAAGQAAAGQAAAGQAAAGQAAAGQAAAGQAAAGQATAGQATAGQVAAGQVAGPGGSAPVVRDIVPLDVDDPRGAGFGAGFLPMAITSMLAGVLIFLVVRRRAARVAALGTYAVLAGLIGAVVLRSWLGIVPGDHVAVAAALGLFALAVSAAMSGLAAALGRPGLGLGALLLFLVSNAVSGIAAAPELLPQPWGEVGQWLPIGAGGTLLRSMAYFDGNGAGVAATVLTAYAVGGLLLVIVGRHGLAGRPAATPVEAAPELVPAP